jgi:hypothetical protein
MLQVADSVPSTIKGPAGEATLQAEIYGPVLEALAAKAYTPKTLRQLLGAVSPMTYDDLLQAVNVLVGMGAVAPCQSEAAEKLVLERCNTLNLQLCKRSLFTNQIQTLASPLTGGGVSVSRFEQLFLIALKSDKRQPTEWAKLAWGVISEQGEVIVKGDQPLTTDEENIAELNEQAKAFAEKSLVVLKALKIA